MRKRNAFVSLLLIYSLMITGCATNNADIPSDEITTRVMESQATPVIEEKPEATQPTIENEVKVTPVVEKKPEATQPTIENEVKVTPVEEKKPEVIKPVIEEPENANPVESIPFTVLYRGFIPVENLSTMSNYVMTHAYLITNEEEWDTWRKKYCVYTCNYFLDDQEFDWDTDCLIVRGRCGSRPTYATIYEIQALGFDDHGNLSIVEDTQCNNLIIAQNSQNCYNVAYQVIKIKRTEIPENVNPLLYEYETQS